MISMTVLSNWMQQRGKLAGRRGAQRFSVGVMAALPAIRMQTFGSYQIFCRLAPGRQNRTAVSRKVISSYRPETRSAQKTREDQ